MPKKPNKIVAIYPGTREIGVAVLQEDSPIYWGVKTLRDKNPREVVLDLIKEFGPQVMVIENIKANRRRKSKKLAGLLNQISRVGRKEKIRLCLYDFSSVKASLCPNEKPTKRKMVANIVSWHPEFSRYLAKVGSHKEKYWQKMFNALALGLKCFNNHDKF